MTHQRNDSTTNRQRKLPSLVAVTLFGLLIVGACFATRSWWDEKGAEAQNPPAGSPVVHTANNGPQIPRATPALASPQKLKTVAVVNGRPITRDQLAIEARRRYGKDVVENLVNKHLILQACQQHNIQITAQEVEAEVTRMAGKFGLSKDRWLEMLKTERNINPQQYRNDIIWPTLALRKLAADKLVISREELLKQWDSKHGEKRQVRMIMLKDKARAEQIQRYLLAHPDEFGKVAKDYSEDKPSAAARGLIPPVSKHVGDKAVETAVFALQADVKEPSNSISPVVFAEDHYFIFKCEKVIAPQRFDPTSQQQAEAILREQLQQQKLRTAATDLFKKLQDASQVVNVYNDPQLQQKMPGVAATVNGQNLTLAQLAEECVARHGIDVLDGEINRELLEQQLKKMGVVVTEADITAEVARAAIMYGFTNSDGSANTDAWLKKVLKKDNVTVDLYMQDAVWPSVALKKLVEGEVQVSEDDLKKGYFANYGEQVDVLVCVLGNQRRAQEVWELAQGNPTDTFFGDLAHQYSIEPTSKYNYGKVPPIRQHSGQPAIEEEAFTLEPGQLSAIIALGDTFIVMRCVGRQKPKSPPEFAAVRDELYKDIHEKKLRVAMSQRFNAIFSAAQIDNFLAGTSQPGQNKRTLGSVRPASAVKPVEIPGLGSNPAAPGSGARR